MIVPLTDRLHLGAVLVLAVIVVLALFCHSAPCVYALSILYICGAALSFAASITDDSRGGVDFLFNFFFLFLIAFPAYAQVSAGVFPWFADLSLIHQALGFGLIAISHCSYLLGISFAMRHPAGPRYTRAERITSSAERFFTRWAAGFAIVSVLFAVAAGPSNLFEERFGREFEGLTQQFLHIARSISLLAMVMMLGLSRFVGSLRLRRWNLLAALVFTPVFFIINYPPALPRFSLMGSLIALSAVLVDYRRPRIKLAMAFVAAVMLFTVFPVLKFVARDIPLSEFLSAIGSVNYQEFLLNVDVDGFMQIASTVKYLLEENAGLRWGYNFLGVLLFFVPRAIWPGKPIDTGELVSAELGYSYNNVCSPLPAEALIAFGPLGPVIIFLGLGYVVLRIEQAAFGPAQSALQLGYFFLYALLMGFIVIILRGALNGVVPHFASGFLALVIMMLMRDKLVFRGAG